MFYKNKLATGVAVSLLGIMGVIGSAQAVHVNPDGTGQVLLFPYFKSGDGYLTHLNIVNSTDKTKAVKIRFREGRNSNDILDFNIYLSPEDVWTGVVSEHDDGNGNKVGGISTGDTSCTLPHLGKLGGSVAFTGHNIYPGVTADDTLEGYIEIIEMGEVNNATVEAGVKHSNGKPANCDAVETAWLDGTFTQGGSVASTVSGGIGLPANMNPPTGGLFGAAAVLNIPFGSAFTYDPVAIDNYSTQAQHYLSDDSDNFLLPSLASGDVSTSNVVTHDSVGNAELVVTEWARVGDACLNDGDSLTPACGTNPYPMAHALLAPHLMNEFILDPTGGSDIHTDWIVTFPMKKHGVHGDVLSSFTGVYDNEETQAGVVASGSFGFSPPLGSNQPDSSTLSREVNVITFESDDGAYDKNYSVFSSPAAQKLSVGSFVQGWARLSFNNYNLAINAEGNDLRNSVTAYGAAANSTAYTTDHAIYKGIPAVGFSAIDGTATPDIGARFGVVIPHKIRRD